jgi:hypothetical protein
MIWRKVGQKANDIIRGTAPSVLVYFMFMIARYHSNVYIRVIFTIEVVLVTWFWGESLSQHWKKNPRARNHLEELFK